MAAMRGFALVVLASVLSVGCGGDDAPYLGGDETAGDSGGDSDTEGAAAVDPHAFAGGCFTVAAGEQALVGSGEDAFAFEMGAGAALYFKAADLATYLLYDEAGGYLVAAAFFFIYPLVMGGKADERTEPEAATGLASPRSGPSWRTPTRRPCAPRSWSSAVPSSSRCCPRASWRTWTWARANG